MDAHDIAAAWKEYLDATRDIGAGTRYIKVEARAWVRLQGQLGNLRPAKVKSAA